jgi:hypothetical protein
MRGRISIRTTTGAIKGTAKTHKQAGKFGGFPERVPPKIQPKWLNWEPAKWFQGFTKKVWGLFELPRCLLTPDWCGARWRMGEFIKQKCPLQVKRTFTVWAGDWGSLLRTAYRGRPYCRLP